MYNHAPGGKSNRLIVPTLISQTVATENGSTPYNLVAGAIKTLSPSGYVLTAMIFFNLAGYLLIASLFVRQGKKKEPF